MNTTIIIVAITIIIFIINIYISCDIKYDVIHNFGHITLKLFGIKIISFDITIVGKYVTFSAKSKKVHRIKIDLYDKSFIFFEILFRKIKNKIVLRQLKLKSNIVSEDIMFVSIFAGIINIFTNFYFKLMQLRHSDADISCNIFAGYRHRQIDVNMEFALTISLFDIVTALLGTIYNFWRLGNEIKKRKAKQ